MRTTSGINFYCRPCKVDKNGYATIQAAITINQKRVFINLPRKEKPEKFNNRKKNGDLSIYLEKTRTMILEKQTEMLLSGEPITAPGLKEYLRTGGVKTYTIKDLFNDNLSVYKKRIGIDLTERTYKKYIKVEEQFLSFLGRDMEANLISPLIIADFYAWLNTFEKPATSASKMQKLKTCFRAAFSGGKIKAFPFEGIKIRKPLPEISYLENDEIKRIREKDFGCERLNRVRDLFILQCYTGLAYADLAALEKEDIREHEGIYYIQKRRVKTGTDFTAVILPPGLDILKKNGWKMRVLSNQRMNGYLKEIQTLCRIDKHITTHLARKTYATHLLNAGISITSVSKMLGHTSVNITTRYYAKTLDATIFNEVKKIMG